MRTAGLAVVATLAALAGASQAQPAPAPAKAKFYADCFAASAAAGSYDRNGGFLRFTCYGATAQAFYEALETYAAPKGWERLADGRAYRFTAEVKKDESGSGVDRCWKAASDGSYGCLLVFPAGKFLDAAP